MPLLLKSLIDEAIGIMIEHWPIDGYADPPIIGFSGGKDSIVLLDLVRKIDIQHEAHYYISTIEPPEVLRFIRENYPEVKLFKPTVLIDRLVRHKGLMPTRHARFCCQYLREVRSPAGRTVFLGVRKEESHARKRVQVARKHTNGRILVAPLLNWAADEIWAYIHDRGLKYPALYDQGWKRTGCVGCPLIRRPYRERDFARWPRIAARWRRMAQYAWESSVRNGTARPEWKTSDDYWNWWMDS